MGDIPLTLALAHYDRHVPFFDGSVSAEYFDLKVLQVGQSAPLRDGTNRHGRMLKKGEFDAAEVSLSSYVMAKSRGWPFTAIPVFPRRLFSQSQIWVRVDGGLESPADLIGRRVGLSSFQTTCSVLAKGDLQVEYGIPWRKIQWLVRKKETVSFEAEEGVVIELIPEGKDIGKMLLDREIDALIMPHPPKAVVEGSKNIGRLFSNPKQEEFRYFQKNGFFPIMHVVAFRNDVLMKHPEAAKGLMAAFEQAKGICRHLWAEDPNWSFLAWGRHLFEEQRAMLGDDPWPNGLEKNRLNLERFIEYSHDQGLIPEKFPVEELFDASTRQT